MRAVTRLPRLVADADVPAVPLTPQTRRLFDAGLPARMKDGALLVNVSRGAVVDTDALSKEAHDGRLRAALDVTDPEPLPSSPPLRADADPPVSHRRCLAGHGDDSSSRIMPERYSDGRVGLTSPYARRTGPAASRCSPDCDAGRGELRVTQKRMVKR